MRDGDRRERAAVQIDRAGQHLPNAGPTKRHGSYIKPFSPGSGGLTHHLNTSQHYRGGYERRALHSLAGTRIDITTRFVRRPPERGFHLAETRR